MTFGRFVGQDQATLVDWYLRWLRDRYEPTKPEDGAPAELVRDFKNRLQAKQDARRILTERARNNVKVGDNKQTAGRVTR